MEGITLDDVAAAHPEAHVFSVEGVLRAETFAPDGGFVGLQYAYTERDLLAKLDG